MKFKDEVVKLGACKYGVDWLGNKTKAEFWATCQRADWMLWYFKKVQPEVTLAVRKKLVLLSCDIAESVLKNVPKDEKRPAEAIRLARAWANGEKVDIKKVKNAANAAVYAAYAANAAASAANAAASAAYAASAANAAASAANAAASAAAASAANAANADLVRKYFPKPPKGK